MLASVDDPRYVDFASCSTRKVKLLLVLTFQNDFDALNHVTCVIFSRILQDHRFPRNVSLTSVDDVCPNQIYHHHARNFFIIMKIIHLLVIIRYPDWRNTAPVLKFKNQMQNFTLPLLAAFCESFSTLNRPK